MRGSKTARATSLALANLCVEVRCCGLETASVDRIEISNILGATLLVISIAMAIYFWRRRDEVEGDSC